MRAIGKSGDCGSAGERFYAQVRVPGEKSARKIPLAALSLTPKRKSQREGYAQSYNARAGVDADGSQLIPSTSLRAGQRRFLPKMARDGRKAASAVSPSVLPAVMEKRHP